jgi:predicted acetyltransferase
MDVSISIPATFREVEELGEVITRVFGAHTGGDWWARWSGRVGQENLVLARRGERVVGGFGVWHGGLWFGGRSLTVGGVAAVGIRPEERGSGVGKALMIWHLQDYHRRGVPLSALYPATVPFYRRFGYELAGSHVVHRLAPSALDLGERRLEARPHEPSYPRLPVIADLYERAARRSSGFFARSESLWRRMLDPDDKAPVNVVVVGPNDAPEGYVVWSNSSLRVAEVHEAVMLTPRAGARILTLLSDLRTIEDTIHWPGPPIDLRLAGLPVRADRMQIEESKSWMLRIVRVAEALRGRGYAPSLEGTTLAFEIEDPILAENSGGWSLSIGVGGRAEIVRRAGEYPLRMSVTALAPLYSGLWRATELAEQGLVDAPPETLAVADHVFAGPHPWMADTF